MRKIKINYPILIIKKIPLSCNNFEGSSIYEEGVKVHFQCPTCGKNHIYLLDINSGALLDNLFKKLNILSKNNIIKEGIAKNASKFNSYLGELSIISNLSSLYEFLECEYCNSNFIIVFSFGESQPGRNICYISGIWQIDKNE